ncbi:MAG TPA: putative lipid II flippase FtsW [Actinomycetota bacterium]|nr:putative lipid II flippase FtsW [Actinomycetota bacterium]
MPSATRSAPRRPRPGHLRLVTEDDAPTRPPAPAPRQDGERSVTALLFATAALTVFGLVMVLSASSVSAYERYGSSFLFFKRQLAYAAVGSVALWVGSRMRYRAWQRLCVPLLGLSVLLLLLVLHPAVGTAAGGSARWIELGPVTVQPSELAKLGVVTFAAALLARRWRRLHDVRRLAVPLVPVVAVVCGLILLQPDMGTAVIVVATGFVLAFAAGARLKHLAAGAAGTGVLGFGLMYVEGYRWARFLSFVDPWADPQGSGYQTIQSLIALASGGPLGVGLGASRQKWSYVPNAHTDFIYSIIGEELGLVGALAVLALFGVLIFAGIRIAVRAPDAFGRLLAVGITGWFAVQAVVNLGAVSGLLPITGVPLPFVSFGGSSLVVSLAAVGILVSIGRDAARRAAA